MLGLLLVMLGAALSGCTLLPDGADARGVDEGERAPPIDGHARQMGGGWISWSMDDHLPESGDFVHVVFVDSDCPFCWREGEAMSEGHDRFQSRVMFVTVGVSLPLAGHDADRAEVAAFQDKTTHAGCYSDREDCADRPGEPHDWWYFDDLDLDVMGEWQVPGTPSHFVLDHDGIVVYNQRTNSTADDWTEALAQLTGL